MSSSETSIGLARDLILDDRRARRVGSAGILVAALAAVAIGALTLAGVQQRRDLPARVQSGMQAPQ